MATPTPPTTSNSSPPTASANPVAASTDPTTAGANDAPTVSANATTKAKKPPLPPLTLTDAELEILQKFRKIYEKTASTKDRLYMLKTKILPRIHVPYNEHLSKEAWRIRKSVSTLLPVIINELHQYILANKNVVSKLLPPTECSQSAISDAQSFTQAGCLPCLQSTNRRNCKSESKWSETGNTTILADFSGGCQ